MIRYYLVGAVFVLGFVGCDVWLALDGVPRNTWSELGRFVGRMTPALPWAVGVLAGHVFHPEWIGNNAPRIGALLACTWIVVSVGIVLRLCGHPIPSWLPLAPGFVAGWLLWPSVG